MNADSGRKWQRRPAAEPRTKEPGRLFHFDCRVRRWSLETGSLAAERPARPDAQSKDRGGGCGKAEAVPSGEHPVE